MKVSEANRPPRPRQSLVMDERDIRLHFEGPRAVGHTIPSQMLVRSLEQVQRVVFLLAKLQQGDILGKRTRVSHELERTFALMCKVPEDGGYAMPQEIGDPGYTFFDRDQITPVARKFTELGQAIDSGDAARVRELVPDSSYRSAILSSYKAAQPPKRSGLVLSIEDYQKNKILNGLGAIEKISIIEAAGKTQEPGETPSYLTGTLIRMDFEEHWLLLKLFSGRSIQAYYNDDYEPLLLENARGLIQIHGNVRSNASGYPESVSDVDEVIELDLSKIIVKSFEYDGDFYTLDKELEFEIEMDEDSSTLCASGKFGIVVCAVTRSELEDQIDDSLRMLWQEYGLAADSELSPQAVQLATELRTAISWRKPE